MNFIYLFLDDNNYVTSYSTNEFIESFEKQESADELLQNCIELGITEEEFIAQYGSTDITDGSHYYNFETEQIECNAEKQASINQNNLVAKFRSYREKYVFPIINRGNAWYWSLSSWRTEELRSWYQEWLNCTDTLVKPQWLDWLGEEPDFDSYEVN